MIKFFLLLLFCFPLLINAQVLKGSLPPSVKGIISEAGLNESNISYSFIPLDTTTEKEYFASDKQILPASLSKILTIYYGLNVLGENYRFRTLLLKKGEIKDGKLIGDLILVGDGDPILSNADLMNFVLALREKGIKELSGSFFYDSSKYPSEKMISSIGLGDQTYNPSVSALSLEFNRFSLWRSGHRYKSIKSQFTPIPNIPYFKIEKVSENFTPGLRFRHKEDKNFATETWQVSNFMRYKIIEEVPIRRPDHYVASTFKMLAENIGIILPEPKPYPSETLLKNIKKTVDEKSLIYSHFSKPLHDIAKSNMEYSNNLLSELILFAADHKYYKSKSLNSAADKMIQWYAKNFPTIGFSGTQFKNGSGLDIGNKIKTKVLTQFISSFASKKFHSKYLLSFFSISGQSGWLTKRMHDPEMSFKVFAKTGSLDYVNNLAGVIFSKSNKPYAFTISLFDEEKRAILNGENSSKVNSIRENAKPWNRDAKPVLDELLRHFYRTL